MAPASVQSKLFSPMTRYIEAQIASGTFKPNDRLAPLRQWGEEFHISLDAVRRGMWHLQTKGLVECRRGSGVYVRDFGKKTQHPEALQIGVLFANQDETRTYCAHALRGIRQQEHANVHLNSYEFQLDSHYPEKIADRINANQALILLGNYDHYATDFSWLRCPAVGVEMHRMHGGLFSVISMDPVNAAELATDYFLKHGKKRVRILSENTPLHWFRGQVFADIFQNAGGCAEHIPFHGRNSNIDWKKNMPEDFGYLFTGGQAFHYESLRFQGDLAHERCVISLDAKSEILPGYSPVTTIGPDWRQVGILALEEAERRALNPGYMGKRIYANVNLIER